MSRIEVALIDYGIGNLLSVGRGLQHCGATVTVTDDAAVIGRAARVVLPGVGAFANGMAELARRGLTDVVRDVAARGRPLLGICLGMQMLLDASEEFGITRGLGLIAGNVEPVPARTASGEPQKIPHIGWNTLWPSPGRAGWNKTLLEGLQPGDAVYFVHSFMANPLHDADRIADCRYGDIPIAAAIGHGNVMGCQFHPEKSGDIGLNVLRAFLRM
jgi:imidazole glycerol-phosphate synthase subunit HisH